jgi:arylsulfatase A-like enzyme
MTDDQELNSMWVMQKVNQLLAQDGTTFANSFVSYPLCCPSRSTFVTGQFAKNHGVMDVIPPTGGYGKLDHENTLSVWLQDAGYFTGFIGKWLNGYGNTDTNPSDEIPAYKEVPPGWDLWNAAVGAHAARYFDFYLNEDGKLKFYTDYQTDIYTQKAVDLINQSPSFVKPYFLFVSFTAPHTSSDGFAVSAPRHDGYYSDEPLPKPPNFNEADVSDKSIQLQEIPLMSWGKIDYLTKLYRSRIESILSVDDAVEAIVDALIATNTLDNTVIFFTSDNGFLLGEHRLHAKTVFYENSIKVPLIIRHPDYLGIGTITQLVSNVACIQC